MLPCPALRFVASVDQAGLLKVEDGWSGASVFAAPGAKAGSAPAMLCVRNTGALLLLGKQGAQALLASGGAC